MKFVDDDDDEHSMTGLIQANIVNVNCQVPSPFYALALRALRPQRVIWTAADVPVVL